MSTHPSWVYRDLPDDDRKSIRQCNTIILRQCGVPWPLRYRVRDFRRSKISVIIATFNKEDNDVTNN
jgi:hypothetical protein